MQKIKKSKKGQVATSEVVFWIVAIALLIVVVGVLLRQPLLEWIKNLPGSTPINDSDLEVKPDELRSLNYEFIGRVVNNRIYYFEKKEVSEQQCLSLGGEWKEACYDKFGFISDKQEDKNCVKVVDHKFGKACFNSYGLLMYNTRTIDTALELDTNMGDSSNGKIELIRPKWYLSNPDIGSYTNDFIVIEPSSYLEYKDNFPKEITPEVIAKLDNSKNIGGRLFKSLEKPEKDFGQLSGSSTSSDSLDSTPDIINPPELTRE